MRPIDLCPHSLQGSQCIAELADAFLSVFLLGQYPTPQDSSQRQEERKSLLGRQRYGGLSPLLRCVPLPATVMEPGSGPSSIAELLWPLLIPGFLGSSDALQEPLRNPGIKKDPRGRHPGFAPFAMVRRYNGVL